MLNVANISIMLGVIIMSDAMLIVIMRSVIMLSATMLSFSVVSEVFADCRYSECHMG
jgi:hypothetical protein